MDNGLIGYLIFVAAFIVWFYYIVRHTPVSPDDIKEMDDILK